MCGLKPALPCLYPSVYSHTLRGCVDWNLPLVIIFILTLVTPYVGVWIETTLYSEQKLTSQVTPYVGVWIETDFLRCLVISVYVTPYVGVWIETLMGRINPSAYSSHPTWVCGLKHTAAYTRIKEYCHTLRGCVDWNLVLLLVVSLVRVTPYVGVWIETCPRSLSPVRWIVTPYVGVWIETPSPMAVMCWRVSHPTWVCGLKRAYYQYITLNHSHTLRGCVDWNTIYLHFPTKGRVTPYVGVWIETKECWVW